MNSMFTSVISLLRWSAALMVVLYHVRFLLFPGYGQVQNKGPALQIFYFVTSLGHEAFVVYMLLSGVMLGGLSYHRWAQGLTSPLGDIRRKAVWFYAILIPALVLGGTFDLVGHITLACTGVYAYFSQLCMDFGWRAIAGNLLMLQRFVVPGLGSNSMLYLLSYECWAYLAFATVFLLRGLGRRIGITSAVLVGAAGAWLAPEFLGYWIVWLLGLAVSRLAYSPRIRICPTLGVTAFLATLAISRAGVQIVALLPEMPLLAARMPIDLLFGIGSALLLGSIFTSLRSREYSTWLRRLAWRLNRRFAGASVAILASHFPFMMFAVAVASALFGVEVAGPPSSGAFLVFVATVIGIFVYAFFFAQIAHAVGRVARKWPHANW